MDTSSRNEHAAPRGETPPRGERRRDNDSSPEVVHWRRPGWLLETRYWALSSVTHLVLLTLVMMIPYAVQVDEEKSMDVELSFNEQSQPPVVKKPPDKVLDRSDMKQMLKREFVVKEDKPVEATVSRRDADEVSRLLSMHDPVLGVARSAAGSSQLYRNRVGKASLVREGGSAVTESAVRGALGWLKRHQSPDGGWRGQEFIEQCESRCANEKSTYGAGLGRADYDVGVTALAMLAMTGYGHTHKLGAVRDYVECLRKAVGYLKQVQVASETPDIDGRYGGTRGHWVYNHSIATLAMGELLVMSGDDTGLKESVERAVRLILRIQNNAGAWRYGIRNGENDTSVTGWMLLALKTARNADLDIPDGDFDKSFRDAIGFIDWATDDYGVTGYTRQGRFRSPVPCMTAVALLSRYLAGESRTSRRCRQAVNICLRHLPTWNEDQVEAVDPYYWYYGSYALFQHGGEPWKKWNQAMQEALLDSQRQGGDEDGSWDPINLWGQRAGRVYATAISAMTLEVYYRYSRSLAGGGGTASSPQGEGGEND